ncbi:MAG: acyl carrier protein [Lachnospiraceae bacterium]|nr:acyl carrier protein [Lachnospiraceae bacterium]
METIISILENILPGEDVAGCETLVDDNILDSFAIITLVGDLEDEYGIIISPSELVPENFNSAKALYEMVERLRGE